MAKQQKGLGDDGKVHVVADKKRGSTERHMTTKENMPLRAAKAVTKAAAKAIKDSAKARRWG
jgi:hypothetical protein